MIQIVISHADHEPIPVGPAHDQIRGAIGCRSDRAWPGRSQHCQILHREEAERQVGAFS